MPDANQLADIIRETLMRLPLSPTYHSEQRDLQPHIQRVLDRSLAASFPGVPLGTTISVGGRGKPSLKLLGTSFWPDVEINEGGTPVAAIEVKLVRERQSASKGIAEALGQALIYSLQYPVVFAFVVHYGRDDRQFHEGDEGLLRHLAPFHVELIIRRPQGTSSESSSPPSNNSLEPTSTAGEIGDSNAH